MTQEHGSKGTTLVIGGTGKTGRRVADRLVKAGRQVRIGSRSAALPFDWEKQDTWEQPLQDVKAAYVAYQPDLAVPGALETVEAFFDRAIASGEEQLSRHKCRLMGERNSVWVCWILFSNPIYRSLL